MTKQTMKPVWRKNTGRGVPDDYAVGKKILHERGDGVPGIGGFAEKILESPWRLVGDGESIYAYQTTRTKAAKYERAECGFCLGYGKHFDPKGDNHLMCPDCNGKGHTLEAIE